MSDHQSVEPPQNSGGKAEATLRQDAREPNWERAALERIALEAVREQRAARRWRIFFRFAFLFVLVVIGWRFAASDEGLTSGPHTALVTLDGEISADRDANAENVDTALEAAFGDKRAAGVILQIDSPGGSPVQAGIIYAKIRQLRAKYPHKPIYTVVGDVCASGGYYVAAATDKIFVDKASIVGSIGVRMDGFGFTGLMDKLGIERRLLTAGANKGFYDPFSPESDKQKEHAQQLLDEVHQQFIAAVRQGRGKRLNDDPELFSGLFWTGERSVQLGLADGFGDADYVAREVIKAPELVDYTVKESFSDRVARKFGTAVGNAAMHTLLLGMKPSLD